MKKAIEFQDAATLAQEHDMPNAAVDLLVDAGIAAADVICCARLGLHATGENHNEAIALLKKAEASMETHLRTLLNVKTKVAYTHQQVSADDLKKASRAAEALVEGARRTSSTSP
ncbi:MULTISPECIES: hypothetical protein [unclassified Mycobacterium]|uniref:hypothetical protein n=1 Tax=unclassified Mycobacterium TaxID=2642494 RepID=UPI0029C95926|nr:MULTISPECIES: hypothetical protein [unclassified Mycobacterium]